MRKLRWMNYAQLQLAAEAEVLEKTKHPDKLKIVLGDVETGVGTGSGWRMQAFIEDGKGALRPQTLEETASCIGCHGGVGATTDSTFSFARKLDANSALRAGWYHWGQHGLKGVPEPKRADGQGEYAHWLQQVGGGRRQRGVHVRRARQAVGHQAHDDGTGEHGVEGQRHQRVRHVAPPLPGGTRRARERHKRHGPALRRARYREMWSGRLDSNQRPLGPEPSALPG